MATPATEVVKVNWKQIFPWLALFRTLGMALHVRQIIVGMIAAALIALGHWLIVGTTTSRSVGGGVIGLHLLDWVFAPMWDILWPITSVDGVLLDPLTGGRLLNWWSIGKILLLLIWGGVVGGLAGGVLVRRAASDFCREESLSLRSAARFAWQRSLDYLSAPGLPLAIIGGLGLLLALIGALTAAIPGGNYLLSVTWAIWLVVGLVMAVLLIAVLFGWPMMIAAVSINGGDGFDSLSRGFGFVLDRWRYYGFCVLVMVAYGSLIFSLIEYLLLFGHYLAVTGLALGMGTNPFGNLPTTLPNGGWSFLLNLILTGFGYSFFWANMAVIYLILRKSVDNAEMDDMYVEGAAPPPDSLQALLNPQQPEPTLLPIIDQPK